jgi:reverse gyrase
MMAGVLEQAVARNDISVKLDAQVARKAKLVATNRGITLAEYLTSIVEPIVARDLKEEMGRMMDQPKGRRAKKAGQAEGEGG